MAKNRISLAGAMLMLGFVLSTFAIATPAHAQWFEDTYPGFYSLQTPGLFQTTLFGGGYISDKYGVLQEGVQAEQSVTPYIGVFGRATGYQLWIGNGFESPLAPGSGSFPRLNFGRFQGGLDFTLLPGTHLYVSAGHDVADSDATVIEGDFSSWLWLHSQHPINASFSTIYDWQNGVESSEIDLETILLSTEKYMILGGIGGAMYFGGFLSNAQGQGGPDLGFYYRPWQLGVSAQAGYGNAHQYGQISMYKQLSWFE
ncbi:MAG: hypothetical protein WCD12_02010 [Candidatus Binatus sp.]|uniref:hypothetical protein n=1 Tax=Candidatus Binatus sp. TaxID=2811406 RepID=UPI003C7776F7